jgi:hypothetical protein
LAFIGSAGHGAFLLCHNKTPLNTIKIPEIVNKMVLYFDSTINKGKLDIKPAKTAPAPIATNRDGNAQQIKVPKLVNKLKEGTIRFLIDKGFII